MWSELAGLVKYSKSPLQSSLLSLDQGDLGINKMAVECFRGERRGFDVMGGDQDEGEGFWCDGWDQCEGEGTKVRGRGFDVMEGTKMRGKLQGY